ncbi:MAG: dihydrodipicolinate synthase family protein [Specibacter sp.]
MAQPFTGLLAYPVTPLTHDGDLNLGALSSLVRNSAAAGVSGATVLATSGAGVTFDRGERRAVVETAVDAAFAPGGASIPVLVAVSAASTREVLHLARDAAQAGASGLLLAPFSYLPLSDDEVRALFAELADATALPVCFYNKPVQTQYDVTPETLAYLAESTTVVAVKETMRREDIEGRIRQLRDAVGDEFSIGLSSDVHLLAELPRVDAWHTGLAALLPVDYVEVWRNAQSGHRQGDALARVQTVALALSEAKHPVGVLHALADSLGVPTSGPRGPFAAATKDEAARLLNAVHGQSTLPQN